MNDQDLLNSSSISRRQMLHRICAGFGGLAMNGLLADQGRTEMIREARVSSLMPKASHVAARAKRVIFLFMHGGPSHIDLFDYKPELKEMDGKPLPFPERSVQFAKRGHVMASPWNSKLAPGTGL